MPLCFCYSVDLIVGAGVAKRSDFIGKETGEIDAFQGKVKSVDMARRDRRFRSSSINNLSTYIFLHMKDM